MKDEHGNGLTIEEMNALTELAISYKNSIAQAGNNHITFFHTWHFKSHYNRSDEATIAEQKRVIEAWRTIIKPQGIHLRVRDATISFNERITIEQYYEWLNGDVALTGDEQ